MKESKIVLCVKIPLSGYEKVVPKTKFGKWWSGPQYVWDEQKPFLLFKTPKVLLQDIPAIVAGVDCIGGLDDGHSYRIAEWEYVNDCFIGSFEDQPFRKRENYHLLSPKRKSAEKVVQKYLDRGWSAIFPYGETVPEELTGGRIRATDRDPKEKRKIYTFTGTIKFPSSYVKGEEKPVWRIWKEKEYGKVYCRPLAMGNTIIDEQASFKFYYHEPKINVTSIFVGLKNSNFILGNSTLEADIPAEIALTAVLERPYSNP
jgi:hypothetical protein